MYVILAGLSEYLHLCPNSPLTIMTSMLIDSGSTHKALSNRFDVKKGQLDHITCTCCGITGFEGSTQTANHSINLRIDDENRMSLFLITQLEDSYNGFLRNPWIKHHQHLIDWANHILEEPSIATAEAVLSYPTTSNLTRGCVFFIC